MVLGSGLFKYWVEWVGYAKRTWVHEKNCNKTLRQEYHRDCAAKKNAEAEKAAAQRKERGGMQPRVRGARVVDQDGPSQAELLEIRAHEHVAQLGLPFYTAYERAQTELGLA